MHVPKEAHYAITAILIALILAMLGGQLLGQPMLIFVETDSMEPILEPGDGYVAIPQLVAGEIHEGQIILFDAQDVGGGGLTTHRVDAVVDGGYVTKGDNNPFTDQDGGEPIVADGQVRSVALQPGGNLLVVPGIGILVEQVSGIFEAIAGAVGLEDVDAQTIGIFALTFGLVALIASALMEGTVRSRVRIRRSLLENTFVVIAILTLIVIIPLNVSMLMPSGVYSFEIVSTSGPTAAQGVIHAGDSQEITYVIQNSGFIPILVFLEAAGPGVETDAGYHRISPRASVETGVVIHAPEETGPHLRLVQEHRYLMILPPPVIETFHRIHPLLAIGAINAVAMALVTLLTVMTLGTGRDRTRVRTRNLSWTERMRR